MLLWNSDAVKEAMLQRHRMQLPSGASVTEYYMENAQRFASPDFLPETRDLLRVKLKTINVTEISFKFEETDFLMIDVGGQRSERKKWLTCFNDVAAVLYLVALNEYDMLLEEDNATNRMEESLKLFSKLSGSQWLRDSAMILFLNKSDIFEQRIQSRPLSECFNDFEDFAKSREDKTESEMELSLEYIKGQFIKGFRGSRIYPFVICALDRDCCLKVFAAVRDAILSSMINSSASLTF